MKFTSVCGNAGATSGRCVSVGVTDGVTGEGVTVEVGVRVGVSLGLGVSDGVADNEIIWVATGVHALSNTKSVHADKNDFLKRCLPE